MNRQTGGIDRLGWITGAVALLLGLVNLVLLLQIGYHALWRRQRWHKIEETTPAAVTALRAEQATVLQQPLRWVDREHGVAGLSLTAARAWVIRREGGEARP